MGSNHISAEHLKLSILLLTKNRKFGKLHHQLKAKKMNLENPLHKEIAMNKPEAQKVEAFQCPLCGALYLEKELADSCTKQCERILATARFGIDDKIALIREGDNRVFKVTGVRVRRGTQGTVYIVFECLNGDGRKQLFPSSIVMSKRAKFKPAEQTEKGG